MPEEPISYIEFAKKVKEKYPQYKDVDDLVLSQKMVEKHPEYKNKVKFEQTMEVSAKQKPFRFRDKITATIGIIQNGWGAIKVIWR